jgi:hypothetical protein
MAAFWAGKRSAYALAAAPVQGPITSIEVSVRYGP